jgi:hypothetical protein
MEVQQLDAAIRFRKFVTRKIIKLSNWEQIVGSVLFKIYFSFTFFTQFFFPTFVICILEFGFYSGALVNGQGKTKGMQLCLFIATLY